MKKPTASDKIMVIREVEKLREEKKITKSDVYSYLGVSKQTYHNWEKLKSEPSLSQMEKISEFLGVKMDYWWKKIEENHSDKNETFIRREDHLREVNQLNREIKRLESLLEERR